MALQPICDTCGEELKKFGAILLSPPDDDSKVVKFHICVTCFERIKPDQLYNKKQKSSS